MGVPEKLAFACCLGLGLLGLGFRLLGLRALGLAFLGLRVRLLGLRAYHCGFPYFRFSCACASHVHVSLAWESQKRYRHGPIKRKHAGHFC